MPKLADKLIVDEYKKIVQEQFPNRLLNWPILSGYNILNGDYGEWIIVIFKDTGMNAVKTTNVIQFNVESIGEEYINNENIEKIRNRIKKSFGLTLRDGVVIIHKSGMNLNSEVQQLFLQHKLALGIEKMKIFLSHKGIDKYKVREYKNVLNELGYEPWLDEDAMSAGTQLERGIQQGFNESCAAIFFVTPNFKDEDYLETEVNYAIMQKRKKKDKFSIITLVFEKNGEKGIVPELLQPYVWKEPTSDLQALTEIIRALPIKIDSISYK